MVGALGGGTNLRVMKGGCREGPRAREALERALPPLAQEPVRAGAADHVCEPGERKGGMKAGARPAATTRAYLLASESGDERLAMV